MLQTINAVLVICGLGLIFVLVGGGTAIGSRRFRRRAHRAQGLVVGLKPSSPHDGTAYYAIIRFTTRQGVHVEARTHVASNPPPARPGRQVRVLYDPDAPTLIRIDNLMGRGTLLGLICVVVGIATLFVGFVVAYQELWV
ncbi:DUF3592 domain-containing protein [Nonomuraea aridisoli]|uniref:DUF3592 domain-containing protein n=1 Tax=Nonomuraea aridisoli TaxID=2070368 RepID=UPI0015E8D871|nr:DUF3592 domain-containing protein [Nonomuraea aridisoli]